VLKIHESSRDFIPDDFDLRAFLEGDKQIWQVRMIDGDAWTGIDKVYRVLQKTTCTPQYSSPGNFTLLKIEGFLTESRMKNLNALLISMEKPHLLMIECKNNQTVNDKLRDTFKELFSILKKKKTMKIILAMQSEGDTADCIQQIATEALVKRFITED
jgi:hypothetical protein